MTVCIAAICRHERAYFVISASDRKITTGDIQFEPPVPKHRELGRGIVALIAGDSAAQDEICANTRYAQPKGVIEAVNIYCHQLSEFNRIQGERTVLLPLGLNTDLFMRNQAELSAHFVEQRIAEMRGERAEIQTIICGVDGLGAQIYRVNKYGQSANQTTIGFAAIGDGEWHAASQFMFAKYTPDWSVARTMLLIHAAKQHAEVAPGVGLDTDMYLISHEGYEPFNDELKNTLRAAYTKARKAHQETLEESYAEIENMVRRPPPQPPPEPQQPQAPSDQPPESPPPESG